MINGVKYAGRYKPNHAIKLLMCGFRRVPMLSDTQKDEAAGAAYKEKYQLLVRGCNSNRE